LVIALGIFKKTRERIKKGRDKHQKKINYILIHILIILLYIYIFIIPVIIKVLFLRLAQHC